MPETAYVTDIMEPNDPELGNLVSVRDLADYWKVEQQFALRLLRENGIRLVQIPRPLMVRWSDVQEFEEAHTITLASKSPKAQRKEAVAS